MPKEIGLSTNHEIARISSGKIEQEDKKVIPPIKIEIKETQKEQDYAKLVEELMKGVADKEITGEKITKEKEFAKEKLSKDTVEAKSETVIKPLPQKEEVVQPKILEKPAPAPAPTSTPIMENIIKQKEEPKKESIKQAQSIKFEVAKTNPVITKPVVLNNPKFSIIKSDEKKQSLKATILSAFGFLMGIPAGMVRAANSSLQGKALYKSAVTCGFLGSLIPSGIVALVGTAFSLGIGIPSAITVTAEMLPIWIGVSAGGPAVFIAIGIINTILTTLGAGFGAGLYAAIFKKR